MAEWIETELRANIELAAVAYNVKAPEVYKNENQIQCRIASHKLYGEGTHKLLKLSPKCPHEKGCGKSSNYVGVQYADEVRLSQLDLDKTWSELNYFTCEDQKTLDAFVLPEVK